MLVLLVIFLLFIALHIFRYYQRVKDLPPGPFPLPLIGNLYQMDLDAPQKTFNKWGKEYGGIYTAWLTKPHIMITDYELIKEALIKKGDIFAGRPRSFLVSIFSRGNNGVIMSEGSKWREQRRFALHVLRDFGFGRNIMEAKIHDQANGLIHNIEMKLVQSTGVLNMTPLLELAVGNIISDVIFGHTFDNDLLKFESLKALMDDNFKSFRTPQAIMLDGSPWLRYIPLWQGFMYNRISGNINEFLTFIGDEIHEHKQNLEMDSNPNDFLTAYLQEMDKREKKGEMGSFDDWQLVTTLGDIWTAGMETTVTTLRWGVLYMILNPEIQQKVHEEIDSVLGSEKTVEMADRSRMPYMAATVNEVQRKANILPLNVLHKNTEEVELGGHRIPNGSIVVPQVHAVLSDPKIYPNPEKFDPNRFLETDGKTLKKSEELIPFSMGKRQCLGESLARMELFLIFTTLLQKFNISVPKGQAMPSDSAQLGITLTPKHYECFVSPH